MSSEPPISDCERLVRFVFDKRCVRENGEVKPDAFIPSPHVTISVTCRAGLSATEIWERGEQVASERKKVLVGKASIVAKGVRAIGLEVSPMPLDNNPEHASIEKWPEDKPGQKRLAQQLAKDAKYCRKP